MELGMDLEVSVSTTRQPIFEVNGRKFFYQGRTSNDVWQAESSPEQLVILAPDFAVLEHRLGEDGSRESKRQGKRRICGREQEDNLK